jgi:hypothetical protein
MSKVEVIEYLGKSKRTVETFVSKGRLGVSYFEGPNGKTAIFQREEVEALKRDIDTPTYRATPETATSRQGFAHFGPTPPSRPALVSAPSASGGSLGVTDLAMIFARAAEYAKPPAPVTMPGPFVGLAEAVELSGMPASWLLAQARAGVPWAVNVGTGKKAFWRFAIAGGRK